MGRLLKLPQDQSNSKMGDHLGSIHFVFFSGRNIRQIRQNCEILLISLNFEINSITVRSGEDEVRITFSVVQTFFDL